MYHANNIESLLCFTKPLHTKDLFGLAYLVT